MLDFELDGGSNGESKKAESKAIVKALRSSMSQKVDENLLEIITNSKEFFDKNKDDYFTQDPLYPNIFYFNHLYDDKVEKEWTKTTKKYLHENAVDFADNIIDWDKLTAFFHVF
mgnify:CR=1 FL=1